MRRTPSAVAVVVIIVVSSMLAACGAGFDDTIPMPVPTATVSASATASPAPEKEPDPVLLPGGTALANLAYFNFVNKRLLAVNSNPSSEAIVENLVNAGFSKRDLEVTPDRTPWVRSPADSIEFSVRTSEGCLLGAFASGHYTSMVGPPVNGDKCLIGETETIQ